MNKLTSIILSSALLFGCMTPLDYYKRETGHQRPHTIEGFHHYASWCKKTERIEDQIWAHQEVLKKLPRGSEEETTERIELGESYLALLKNLELKISANRYSPNFKNFWMKAQKKCIEAKEVSLSIPSRDIRFYWTREEIGYLCDRFNHQRTLKDFQTF